MATHPIQPTVDLDEYFAGLARQDLDFHQALGELVDNALSARKFTDLGPAGLEPSRSHVEIVVEELENLIRVIVADSGIGMTVADLQNHVFGLGQRGRTSDTPGSMNEHGFGLKNALAVLTGGDSSRFKLVTRSTEDALGPDQFLLVHGPFADSMSADDDGTRDSDWAPSLGLQVKAETGTRIQVDVDPAFFRTTWRRRGRVSQFPAYVTRLAEHLGVIYREFIDSGDRIFLTWRPFGGEQKGPVPVIAIHPPYGSSSTAHLRVASGSKTIDVKYVYGENDYQLRDDGPEPDKKVQGDGDPSYPYPLKIYYQGSSGRSGADIIVRKRLIRTQVWREIWADIDHTVEYNKWLAELVLDGHFHTTNNKTGMDPNDPAWQALVDLIGDRNSEYSPAKTSPAQTEKSIEDRLAEFLRIQNGNDNLVAQQVGTWQGATTADIVVYGDESRRSIDQIYEVKAGRGTVDDVYQLVCQWDGFVRDGLNPAEGILYCRNFDHKPITAVEDINKRDDGSGKKYNLRVTEHPPTLG